MSVTQETVKAGTVQLPDNPLSTRPALPAAVKDAKATREILFTLRHFHLGDPAAGEKLETLGGDLLPALLEQFRDTTRLRYTYPLLLHPTDTDNGEKQAQELTDSAAPWLSQAVTAFAPDESAARILKDSLPWLERHLREELGKNEEPEDARTMLDEAGTALKQQLRLSGADEERLSADLEQLVGSVPEGSQLLGYGRYVAIQLLIHAIRSRVVPRLAHFQRRIDDSARGLKELLKVEWGKSDESRQPQRASGSVGPSGDLFNAEALSAVMDHSRGTHRMLTERRERIEKALSVLESWKPDNLLVRFVHDGRLREPWVVNTQDLNAVVDADPCARATELFDEQAAKQAEIFSALHIAQLEIDNVYDPVTHDPWFASFNWQAFSKEELLLIPTVIALDAADRIAGEGLRSFSRLLSSGRPVQVLVRILAASNPGAAADENPFQSYRTELGYLGISHRQAVVDQSSSARHEHLLQCFLSALDATQTSLHLLNVGLRPPSNLVPLNAWLIAGAAIESRAHPFFRINPAAGDSASARMDFSGNPQPERDWPVHTFSYQDENGITVDSELAFTFADYALLIERLRDHFRLIPPSCDSPSLVTIQEYLAMDPERAYESMPFIWAVDAGNVLHRVLVSRELTLACLDRRNYWNTLQEMAGVRNRYVDLAIEHTRDEEQAKAAAERERLLAEQAAEVERVRNESAGEALQRLADTLLGLDLTAAVPAAFSGVPSSQPAPAEADAVAATEAEEAPAETTPDEEEEEELSFDEPWIDTPLCTSCNDCMKVNALVFVYNEEKQAVLGDAKKDGTYAQMVEAAELCPAQCIHPGKPWNPDEPGLDELVQRATPFNQ